MKHDEHEAHTHLHGHRPIAKAFVKDPVCGMSVDPMATAHHATHAGNAYHFCRAGCRAKFIADPAQYASGALRAQADAAPGAIWTCPMHPEIRRNAPGSRSEEPSGGKECVRTCRSEWS